MTAAGSDFSMLVLGPDPVRSAAGKSMIIPISVPPPLAAARRKSAAADLIRARLTPR